MLYKFKSKVTGDLIMLEANGDRVMRILGREPAAQGIIEVAAMPGALAALEAAVAADEATSASAGPITGDAADHVADPAVRVSLRQRVWPLVETIRRAHAAGADIVWGV